MATGHSLTPRMPQHRNVVPSERCAALQHLCRHVFLAAVCGTYSKNQAQRAASCNLQLDCMMLVLVTHIAVQTYQSDCERLHNTQRALQQTALEALITSCLGVKRVSTARVYVQWQGIDSA